MRIWIGAAVASVVVVAVAAVALYAAFFRAGPARTQVVRWSPFDSTGAIKDTLRVEAMAGNAECGGGPASEAIGFAYRCGAGNQRFDPCWRDGSGRTDFVICVDAPWSPTAVRLRVPQLMLLDGVTFSAAADYPWGVELTDGNRCLLAQGAHDNLPRSEGGLVVDFYCSRGGIVLLRDLRRDGRIWTIGSARYHAGHYTRLGEVGVRRAYLGGLPPELSRQNALAESATATAERIARQREKAQLGTPLHTIALRVRLALPHADWASVSMLVIARRGTWAGYATVILHRTGQRWTTDEGYRPYCRKLPNSAREQLFTEAECARAS